MVERVPELSAENRWGVTLALVVVLTSRSELPTLTPLSSSACGNVPPRGRISAGRRRLPAQLRAASTGPHSPNELGQSPRDDLGGPFIGGHGYADRDDCSPSD